MSFAERLKDLRAAAGMTQQQLADRAGIPKQSVLNYEQGRRLPIIDQAERLAKGLGVSLDAFSGSTDAKSNKGKRRGPRLKRGRPPKSPHGAS